MKSHVLAFAVLCAFFQAERVSAQTVHPASGLEFNGAGWMTMASSSGLQHASAFTIETWFLRLAGSASGGQVIVQKPNSYTLQIQGGNLTFDAQMNPGNTTSSLTTPASSITSGWHHVAVTFDSSAGALRMFFDGTLQDAVTGLGGKTLVQSNTNLRIGGTPSVPAGTGLFGRIDELRIWSLRRTSSQIVADNGIPLRDMSALELVFSGDGPSDGASAPSLLTDETGHNTATVNGTVTYGPAPVSAPAHPGTGTDLIHFSSVSGGALSLVGDKSLACGDPFVLGFSSPASLFDGEPFYWPIQLLPAGTVPAATAGLPDFRIDLASPYGLVLAGAPLPPNGFAFGGNAPSLVGIDVWSQGIVVTPVAPNGYAATDAHVLHFVSPTVYANPSAPAGGTGSQASPFNTLSAAIAAACAGGTVKLSTGTFNETVTLSSAVNILGGFHPTTWAQTSQNTVINTNRHGMAFRDISTNTTIAHLDIWSANGLAPGSGTNGDRASIATDIRDCTAALQFDHCTFNSGDGAAGAAGTDHNGQATSGGNGGPGADGQSIGGFLSSGAAGGGGAGLSGRGGDGGWYHCTNFNAGTCWALDPVNGADGGDGTSQNCNIVPGGAGAGTAPIAGEAAGSGANGSNGSDGSNGVGGAPIVGGGFVDANHDWRPNTGTAGTDGVNGCSAGGGGGGGARGQNWPGFALGGGGGGGGQGGGGGLGGGGGRDGAPAVASWLVNASPTFTSCTFAPGNGGTGGRGGNGQAGGDAGHGGSGGSGAVRGSTVGGSGGNGGEGGSGGAGGGGSGGSGGSSWGVVRVGTSNPANLLTGANNVFTLGNAGAGGIGGASPNAASAGVAGVAGTVSSVKTF